MSDFNVVGKSGNFDKTLVDKLIGRLDYADDRMPGKKLFTRALLTPYAHAEVVRVDKSAAEAIPGVKAITSVECCPVFTRNVRYGQQDIAAVAAVDPETAARGVAALEVEYDVKPHIIDPDEAAEPGADHTGVWEDTNVRTAEIPMRGDVEAGMDEADQIIEVTAGWSNYWQHRELEPRSCVAQWVGDHLYIWTTSQNPFGQRAGLTGRLVERLPDYTQPEGEAPVQRAMPMHKIHLVSHGSGSGHGNKHFNEWLSIASTLSDFSGMPVTYHLNREEQHCGESTHQNGGKITLKVGVKDDGTITALDSTITADGCGNGATTALGMQFPLQWTFKVPNAHFKGIDVATNKPKRGPWRCVADPPGDAIMSLALDKVAAEIGMNPLDFRLKNLMEPDMVQYETGLPFASMGVRECFEKAAEAVNWNQNWHAPGERTLDDGRKHGMGISGHIDSHGQMSAPCGAILHLTKDGHCLINPGQSHCAGSINAFAVIVAETLGMKYDDVSIGEWGNTDVTSEGGSEGGSTQTITLGSAYYEAAMDARNEAFEIAAEWMGVEPDELDAEDGVIFEKNNRDNSRTWQEVAGRFRWPIIGKGHSWEKRLRRPLNNWDVGDECEVRGQLAAAIEIAVDTETGHIEILKFANAIDNGMTINYHGFMNSTYGGCEIMHGQMMNYEQVIDHGSGLTLNPNMWQNSHVTSMDINPEGYTAIAVESDDHCGTYGCKGVGEPQVSSIACLSNAFYNATGVWIDSLPITPDKVLKALGKA